MSAISIIQLRRRKAMETAQHPHILGQGSAISQANSPQPSLTLARHRLAVAGRDVLNLVGGVHEMRVLCGAALVLHGGHKHLLHAGESQVFTGAQRGVTIVAMDESPLVVEVALDTASTDHLRLKQQFYERMAARQNISEAEM